MVKLRRRRSSARHHTKHEADDDFDQPIFDLVRKRKQPHEPFKTLRPRKTIRLNQKTDDDDQTIDQEVESEKEARSKLGKLRYSGTKKSRKGDSNEIEARRLPSEQRRSAAAAMGGEESNSEDNDDQPDSKYKDSSLPTSKNNVKAPRRVREKPRQRAVRRSSRRGSGSASSRTLKEESTDTDEAPSDSDPKTCKNESSLQRRYGPKGHIQHEESKAHTLKTDDGTEEQFYDAVENESSLLPDAGKDGALSSNSEVPCDTTHNRSPKDHQRENSDGQIQTSNDRLGAKQEEARGVETKSMPPHQAIDQEDSAVGNRNQSEPEEFSGIAKIETNQVELKATNDDPPSRSLQNLIENESTSSRNSRIAQPGITMAVEQDVADIANMYQKTDKLQSAATAKNDLSGGKAMVLPSSVPETSLKHDGDSDISNGNTADISEARQYPSQVTKGNPSRNCAFDRTEVHDQTMGEAERIPEPVPKPTEGTKADWSENDVGDKNIVASEITIDEVADTSENPSEVTKPDGGSDEPVHHQTTAETKHLPEHLQNPTEGTIANTSRNVEVDKNVDETPGFSGTCLNPSVTKPNLSSNAESNETANVHDQTIGEAEDSPDTEQDLTEGTEAISSKSSDEDNAALVVDKIADRTAVIRELNQKNHIEGTSKKSCGYKPAAVTIKDVDEVEDSPDVSKNPTEGVKVKTFADDDGNDTDRIFENGVEDAAHIRETGLNASKDSEASTMNNDDGNKLVLENDVGVDRAADAVTIRDSTNGIQEATSGNDDNDKFVSYIEEKTVDAVADTFQNPKTATEVNLSIKDELDQSAVVDDNAANKVDVSELRGVSTGFSQENPIRNEIADRPMSKSITKTNAAEQSNQDPGAIAEVIPYASDGIVQPSTDIKKTIPESAVAENKVDPNKKVKPSSVDEEIAEVESSEVTSKTNIETYSANNIDDNSSSIRDRNDEVDNEEAQGQGESNRYIRNDSVRQQLAHSRVFIEGGKTSSIDIQATGANAIDKASVLEHRGRDPVVGENGLASITHDVYHSTAPGGLEPAAASIQREGTNRTMVEHEAQSPVAADKHGFGGSTSSEHSCKASNQGQMGKGLVEIQTPLPPQHRKGIEEITQNMEACEAPSKGVIWTERATNSDCSRDSHVETSKQLKDTVSGSVDANETENFGLRENAHRSPTNSVDHSAIQGKSSTETISFPVAEQQKAQKNPAIKYNREIHELRMVDGNDLPQDKSDQSNDMPADPIFADQGISPGSKSPSKTGTSLQHQFPLKAQAGRFATEIAAPDCEAVATTPCSSDSKQGHKCEKLEIAIGTSVGNSQPQHNYEQREVVNLDSISRESAVETVSRSAKRPREEASDERKRMCPIRLKPPENLLSGSTSSRKLSLSQAKHRKPETKKRLQTTSKRLDLAKYQRAISLSLSGSLPSKEIEKQRKIIKSFLRTKKVKALHNKFIIGLLERCSKREIVESDILHSSPSNISASIKPGRCLEALKSSRTAPTAKLIDSCSSVADVSTATEKPIPIPFTSSRIPGALLVDPYVRVLAQSQGMRINESAVWLVVVAMKEFANLLLSNCIEAARSIESNIPPTKMRGFPQALSMSEHKEATLSHDKAEAGNSLTKRQGNKQITSLDVLAVTSRMPISARSLSGCVSRVSYERSVRASHYGRPVNTTEHDARDDVRDFCFNKIAPPPRAPSVFVKPDKEKGENLALEKSHSDAAENRSSVSSESKQKTATSKPVGNSSKDLSALVTSIPAIRLEPATSNTGIQDEPTTATASDASLRDSRTGTKNLAAMIARNDNTATAFESTVKPSPMEASKLLPLNTSEKTTSATKEMPQSGSFEDKGTAVGQTAKGSVIDQSSQVCGVPVQVQSAADPAQNINPIDNAINPSRAAAKPGNKIASHVDVTNAVVESSNGSWTPMTQNPTTIDDVAVDANKPSTSSDVAVDANERRTETQKEKSDQSNE